MAQHSAALPGDGRVTRPGPPRRRWCEVPRSEWATVEARWGEIVRTDRSGFTDRMSIEEWGRGSRTQKALDTAPHLCPAAIEWSAPGSGLWYPCTTPPARGERYCYRHGGRSPTEVEGGYVPRSDNCERDDTVRIAVNLGSITIEGLPDAVKKIERRARAVNAPENAVVKFETTLVRLHEADGPDTDAVIEWTLAD